MKLLKPAWVNHDDNPIFSIDIHPDGTRFATGGQGQDSAGRVVIWNMVPVLQCHPQNNGNNGVSASDAPKILCQLDHHNACVNCVRWSNSGKYLASGGDDKAIMIWKLISKGRPTQLMGNAFGKPTYENWKPISDLRNHRGDILHLSWSPEDKYLASASVDNKVIIWDAQQFPLVVHELAGHTSLVKGVSWDPIGTYLATQSDDKTLKIWRTSDWQQEQVISEPYQECAGTTHVLRLDWSPDGLYLVSAHAMNKGGPTAQIVEREGWKTDKDFVGHRKAVVCVRFNPNILQDGKSKLKFCIVALGSRDRSISVWSTNLQRPLLVVSELFTNSVMDLSWSSCGKILMACSWDGTAAAIVFKKSEIGDALTTEETLNVHQKYYGSRISMKSNEIVQNLDVYLAMRKMETEASSKQETNTQKSHLEHPIQTSPDRLALEPESQSQVQVIRGPIDKQIETRTSDGKRRITPKFLLTSSDGIDGNASNESNSNHFGTFDTDKKDQSQSQVSLREKMISNISEVKIPGATTSETSVTNDVKPNIETDESSGQVQAGTDQNEEKDTPSTTSPTLDTVTDSSVVQNGDTHDGPPVLEKMCNIEPSAAVPELPKVVDKELNEESKKVDQPEQSSSKSQLIGVKRKLPTTEEMKPPTKLPKKGKPTAAATATSSSTSLQAQNNATSAVSLEKSFAKEDRTRVSSPGPSSSLAPQTTPLVNGCANPASPSKSPKPTGGERTAARLPAMKSEPFILRRVLKKKDISYTLHADNAPALKGAFILTCQHDPSSLNGLEWNICTPYAICDLSGDSLRIVALTEDSSAHILDVKGRYVLPPLILDSYPSTMFHCGPYLLIATVRATIHMWNIHTKKCIIKSESIEPLLDQCAAMDQTTKVPLEIAQMDVTKLGSPILILTNAKMFHYNTDMQSWMHYVDPGLSMRELNIEFLPLCTWRNPLNNKLTFSELRNLRKSEPYAVTQIKLKLATATELQLPDAVHMALITLAKLLACHGLKQELRQLCEDLMGPTHSSAAANLPLPAVVSSTPGWNPKIVGVCKRQVLRSILKCLLQDLQWQEFYAEFNDSLTEFEEMQKQAQAQSTQTSETNNSESLTLTSS